MDPKDTLHLVITSDRTGEILHDAVVPDDATYYTEDFGAYLGQVLAEAGIPDADLSGHSIEMYLVGPEGERLESALHALDGDLLESEGIAAVERDAAEWLGLEEAPDLDEGWVDEDED